MIYVDAAAGLTVEGKVGRSCSVAVDPLMGSEDMSEDILNLLGRPEILISRLFGRPPGGEHGPKTRHATLNQALVCREASNGNDDGYNLQGYLQERMFVHADCSKCGCNRGMNAQGLVASE
jgi:hypothetical protein